MSTENPDIPSKRPKHDSTRCIQCNLLIRTISGIPQTVDNKNIHDLSTILNKSLQLGDQICSKCRAYTRKQKYSQRQQAQREVREEEIRVEQQSQFEQGQVEVQQLEEQVQQQEQVEEGQKQVTRDMLERKSKHYALQTFRQLAEDELQRRAERQAQRQELQLAQQQAQQSFGSGEEQPILAIETDAIPGCSRSTTIGYDNVLLSQVSIISSPDSKSSHEEYVVKETPLQVEIERIDMPFKRPVSTHNYCCVCFSKKNFIQIPFEARIQAFTKKRIFIPDGNKCCPHHLIKKRFFVEELDKIKTISNTSSIKATEIAKFLDELSEKVDLSLHDNVNDCFMTDERIKALTGYTWDNINHLRNLMTTMRNSDNRSINQALITFLFKLRSGNSDNLIAAIMGISERQVSASVHSVLKCFEEDVLPKHFGYHILGREYFLQNGTAHAAGRLHDLGNRLAIICDGTYLRHQKSANNIYQRKSYSGQKKTSLCKPFTICTTNGIIVDVAGPFNANLNDAQILEFLLSDPSGLSSVLREGDILVLDRGFRDVTGLLKERGYKVLMPALKGKRNQLTTKESNESRLVTKIRWVVEAIHGVIGQKCKLFHHQLHNGILPNAGTYCKIACFLYNLFGKRLNSDNLLLDSIINRMQLTNKDVNTLADEIEKENWSRKSVPFQVLPSDELLDFPELTSQELQILFTGSYQLKQSVSYLAEMLEDDDTLLLSYLKVNPEIIRFEVHSRHINRKNYKCYIHYVPDRNDISGIQRYACSCANGRRTVGCCSHVAAMIFYLSYARYQSKIVRPAEILTSLFDFDEENAVIDEDSDED